MGMYKDLEDKIVIITGGGSGIGQATAGRFIDEGSKVCIFDINEAAMEETKRLLPGVAGTYKVDVSDEQSVKAGFCAVDSDFGRVDVLISNAGVSFRNKFVDTPYEQWRKTLGINLDGMFLCAKEAAIRMEKQGGGVILMTASDNGMEGHPYYTDYNASKAGVILLGKTIALECAPKIRCNGVAPGYVLTPMQKAEYTEEALAKVNDGLPMKRHAEPSEVAALFAYLASDEAKYITGQFVPICGGETAGKYIPMD